MDGCSAPLVVKFADTQKEKEQKKFHHLQANVYSSIGGNTGNPVSLTCGATLPAILNGTGNSGGNLTSAASANGIGSIVNGGATTNGSHTTATALGLGAPQATGLCQNATSLASAGSMMTNPPQQMNPFIGADAISTTSLHLLQQLQAVGLQQQLLQGLQNIETLFFFLIKFPFLPF